MVFALASSQRENVGNRICKRATYALQIEFLLRASRFMVLGGVGEKGGVSRRRTQNPKPETFKFNFLLFNFNFQFRFGCGISFVLDGDFNSYFNNVLLI